MPRGSSGDPHAPGTKTPVFNVLLPERVSKLRSVEIKEMSNKTSIRRYKIKYGQGEQVRLCLGA